MPKFFGRFFDKRPLPSQYSVAWKPAPLTKEENAIATLIFCLTTQRGLPDGISAILLSIDPTTLKEPYVSIVSMFQKSPTDLEELEVIYTVLLESTMKAQRKANKDFAPVYSAIPGDLGKNTQDDDWYDRTNW
jgi:hypothetical protein